MLSKNRIEAFSDGVIAIIITIMAFDLKIQALPVQYDEAAVWQSLLSLLPKIASYLLSYVVLAILWLNHHALFERITHATPALVWHNMTLLFTMSLIPMTTHFWAAYPFLPQAVMLYGLIMSLTAFTFLVLRRYVEVTTRLAPLVASVHRTNLWAVLLYLASIPLSLVSVYLSFIIFVSVPAWYFFPRHTHLSSDKLGNDE